MEKGEPNMLKIPWLHSYIPDHIPKEDPSLLSHLCSLDSSPSAPTPARQAKIFCTIGPGCRDVKTLEHMIEAGMTLARINFSHGDYNDHQQTITNIRLASAKYSARLGVNHTVAIAADLKGPEIRTGVVDGLPAEFELLTGNEVTLTSDWNFETKTNQNLIYIDYNQIEYAVKVGDELIVDHGELLFTVKKVNIPEKTVLCKIKRGGVLRGERSVLIPGVPLEFPVVTAVDIAAIKFAMEEEVDFVFVSLLRNADPIREIKELPFKEEPLHRARFGDNGPGIKVVASVDNLAALSHIDDIIGAADAVVLCRRGLGLELDAEHMFLAQKTVIAKCQKQGKPVTCAQLLFEGGATASRAETIDLATCITDGCDSLLLTSRAGGGGGRGSVACVRDAARVCRHAEMAVWSRQLLAELKLGMAAPADAAHAIAVCVVETSRECRAAAIVVLTTSGRSARLVSRYRPACPIVAVTRLGHVARQMVTCRGVMPVHYTKPSNSDWLRDVDLRVDYGLEYGRKMGFVKAGDCVLVVTGWRQGAGFTNTLRVIYVPASEAQQLGLVALC